jgi:hypothetical protein
MLSFCLRLRHSLTCLVIFAALSLLLSWQGVRRVSGQNAVTTVSAASYTPLLAPDSIAAAYGARLATQTTSAISLPLPTNLAGTTVRVNGVLAGLFFVSPTQVNYAIPGETQPGSANVVVTAGDGTVSTVQCKSAMPPRGSLQPTRLGAAFRRRWSIECV